MIDKVVILGIRRGGVLVPDMEVSQMMGRGGRSYEKQGRAVIVAPSCDAPIACDYISRPPSPVVSGLPVLEELAFHVLPELAYRRVTDEGGFKRWYGRSLASVQGKTADYNAVMDYLESRLCVVRGLSGVEATELGWLSVRMYVRPETLLNKCEKLSFNLPFTPLSMSWLMASPVESRLPETEGSLQYRADMSALGVSMEDNEWLSAYAYWCLLTRSKDAGVPGIRRKFAEAFIRECTVMDGVCKLKMTGYKGEFSAAVSCFRNKEKVSLQRGGA